MIAVRAERQVVLLDLKSFQILGFLPQLREDGRMGFLAAGKAFVTQDFGTSNRLWNVASLQPTGRFMELNRISDLVVCANGWRLAAVAESELLRVDATPKEPDRVADPE